MLFVRSTLLEIPDTRNQTPSICDSRNGSNLALLYHRSESPNQYNFGPRTNTYRKNNYYQKPYRNNNESNIKSNQNYEKQNMVWKTDCISKEMKKSKGSIPEMNRPLKVDEPIIRDEPIINLEINECKETLPLQSKPKLIPKEFKWDEPKTELSFELQQLTTNDPKKWKKPFPLENGTAVIVQYFEENPTTSCWVIQSKHAQKRNALLQETKQLHCQVNAVERNGIIENEVYCVERDNIYHRGEVLYYNQINSKEAFVRLIDNGRSFQTRINNIKNLNPLLKSINAFAFEINLETLLDVHVGQILPIEKAVRDAVGAISVKLGKEEKRIEIELIPFPVDVPVELFCLDYSNIELGYISACKHDPEKIESINSLSDKIEEYLLKLGKTEKYLPKLDDICLAYHDSEKQWYRAECIKILNPNCLEVLFIDYGNTKIVSSSNVRKIVSKFMEPAIMHFCRLHGKFIIVLALA